MALQATAHVGTGRAWGKLSPDRGTVPRTLPRRAQSAVVHAEPGKGPTGLNVNGYRPTNPRAWEQMVQTLKQAKVKILSPQEVTFASERKQVLLDVRPSTNYEQGHLPGAVNVPFYQPIQGWSPWKVARRAGFALFGVLNGTEPNPDFLPEVEKLVDKQQGAILYCSQGGSMETEGDDKHGRQTRSMIAAYTLVSAGFQNISVLRGGYNEWVAGGRDIVVIEFVDATEEAEAGASLEN